MSAVRLYRTRITHARRSPVKHAFAYRGYSWLVDVDRLDDLPWVLRRLGRFDPRDVGDATAESIAADVRGELAARGIAHDGRILMLAAPRAFGYAFNPLTVFWCHDQSGALAAVIAEVHNTYGERHRYVLRQGGQPIDGFAVDKAFRVSPFHDTSGRYRLTLPEPDDCVRIVVRLDHPGGLPFVATVSGAEVAPASQIRHGRAVLCAHGLLTSARIRRQGAQLWLKRVPRPAVARVDAGAGEECAWA